MSTALMFDNFYLTALTIKKFLPLGEIIKFKNKGWKEKKKNRNRY